MYIFIYIYIYIYIWYMIYISFIKLEGICVIFVEGVRHFLVGGREKKPAGLTAQISVLINMSRKHFFSTFFFEIFWCSNFNQSGLSSNQYLTIVISESSCLWLLMIISRLCKSDCTWSEIKDEDLTKPCRDFTWELAFNKQNNRMRNISKEHFNQYIQGVS